MTEFLMPTAGNMDSLPKRKEPKKSRIKSGDNGSHNKCENKALSDFKPSSDDESGAAAVSTSAKNSHNVRDSVAGEEVAGHSSWPDEVCRKTREKMPNVTLTRIDVSREKPSTILVDHRDEASCDTTLPVAAQSTASDLDQCHDDELPQSKVIPDMSSASRCYPAKSRKTECLTSCPTSLPTSDCAQASDYMGLALKQWSMYLGNVLLNFIHKECKSNNNNNASSMSSSTSTTFHVDQWQQQQHLSSLAAAVSNRTGSTFLQAAAAVAAVTAASNSMCQQSMSSTSCSKEVSSPSVSSSSFTAINKDEGVVSSTDVIGDATTVIAQGYCPCCHYHNQMQQQQPSQQHQQVMLAAAAAQQLQSQSCANNFQQGYFNYAANFSPFFANQRHYVQGKDPSVDFTQDIVEESEDERCFEDMNDSVPPIELPPCELSRLDEISELVSSCLPSPMRREKLAIAIENEVYIKKLLNLFHMCEDLENTEGLHHLYEIFKNIFLLNKNALFELMFAEDTIFDVVGCLEFDPSLTVPKRHREYLKSIATFHQVIKISNPQLLQKIHQTYRIQYIQDVVLPTPSVFEENMLSTLSSFIFFNKQEIVSMIQEDEKFLTELFAQLTGGASEDTRRKELVLFLKEFCTFAQALQPPGRDSFFKTLNSLGILQALEITLQADDHTTKAASIDILLFIVEFSPSMVREYMLQQLNNTEDDTLLMNVIIEQMTCDSDPEMGNAVQLTNIIRMLLDPENMLTSVNKSEKTDFLNFFYKHCMHVLISPLLANTAGEKPVKSDSCTVQLLSLILELLSFYVEHHTYHIKNYILHKDLLRRILFLMKSRHTFLVLYALRFMRKIVALKDEFYNRYIIKGNLFAPVVDALVTNNGRYNLLDSAILEMFEFIKLEDIKSLCSHVVENFGPTLDKITYVQTFKALRQRYDQQQDRQKERPSTQLDNVGSILRQSRFRRDPRQLEEDEETWFNEEDDFDGNVNDNATSPAAECSSTECSSQPQSRQAPLKNCFLALASTGQPTIHSDMTASGKNNCCLADKASPKNQDDNMDSGTTSPSASSSGPSNLAKKGLVDYEGDSDEDEWDKDAAVPEQKPSQSKESGAGLSSCTDLDVGVEDMVHSKIDKAQVNRKESGAQDVGDGIEDEKGSDRPAAKKQRIK